MALSAPPLEYGFSQSWSAWLPFPLPVPSALGNHDQLEPVPCVSRVQSSVHARGLGHMAELLTSPEAMLREGTGAGGKGDGEEGAFVWSECRASEAVKPPWISIVPVR